jgi:hypothetical protein
MPFIADYEQEYDIVFDVNLIYIIIAGFHGYCLKMKQTAQSKTSVNDDCHSVV